MRFNKTFVAAAVAALALSACGGGDPDEPIAETLAVSTAAARPSTGADTPLPGEVLVVLRRATDMPAVRTKHKLTLQSQLGARPIYRFKLPAGKGVDAAVRQLRADKRVMTAEGNLRASSPEARRMVVWTIGEEADYADQWAHLALELDAAHAIGRGAGVRVAVLDTGVDRAHPALAPRLLPGYDYVDGDADPSERGDKTMPAFGHGTHVAGLVALAAPDAKIVPYRVLEPSGTGNIWVIAQALMKAVDPDGQGGTPDGAHVVNLSLGTTKPTDILDIAVELATCSDDDDDEEDNDYSDPGYAADHTRCNEHTGAVVVAAAGNGGSATELHYPAAEGAEGAISVAATQQDDTLASFSNRGAWIGIAAPGHQVTSPVPGGGYGVWSGTSMAAPLTAGVAALLRGREPHWKPVDVTKRLQDRSGNVCGSDTLRQVNAYGAVRDEVPPDTPCS